MRTIAEKTMKPKRSKNNMKVTSAFSVLALIAVLFIAGCQQAANTINVQGTAELKYKPDQATVFTGVSVLKPTAQEAQSEANRMTAGIMDALEEMGIPENDIGTQQFSLYEEFTATENGTRTLGWRAMQIISIRTSDLTKVGPIVDACIENGANQVQSINFELTLERENEYKQVALAEASVNAQKKAESIASSLKLSLGNIKTISESSLAYIPYTYALKDSAGVAAVTEASSIAPPDLTVMAMVSLEYYIS